MKYRIDHDFHIHSSLSECSSDSEQNKDRLLEYAKASGLKRICITDHYWDESVPGASDWYKPQNFEHISKILPLPTSDGIEFLFGCETDMDKFLNIGISAEQFDKFDFIIIPTTHLHMTGFTITPEDKADNKRIAELWVERFEHLLSLPLLFHKIGVAHPACGLLNNRSRADYLDTLSMISDEDMERVFTKAAKLGCGIEINRFDLQAAENDENKETAYRMFRIAKKCGCKFYLGGDAHHPKQLESAIPVFERIIDTLGLTEDDKFHIGAK